MTRNKESSCHFETGVLLKRHSSGGKQDAIADTQEFPSRSTGTAQVAAFGYSGAQGGLNTTLDLYKKIEEHGSSAVATPGGSSEAEIRALCERYKSLVRQLPPKDYISTLLATFFRECNPFYYPIDESMFRDLLEQWDSIPFSLLEQGPYALHPDLQCLPALILQMLALALQLSHPVNDTALDNLKYVASMSLDDLATDYSASATYIVELLGGKRLTLITVQTGFLRCCFLKNSGQILESWHALSRTIRDAQEIHLHRAISDTPREGPTEVVEHLWTEQMRRRMWMILSLWDIRMSLGLGRPTTINIEDAKPPFPIDAPIPKDRHSILPEPRGPTEPPTALTMLLWNAELAAPLWDIAQLEREGTQLQDYSRIETMHKLLNHVNDHCPAFFRGQAPDTTFDSHPDCGWLPKARVAFQSLSAFNIMALHRPYIFTQPASRTAALRSALEILRSQRTYFELIGIAEYRTHAIVLTTFDAIVLAAAIYILHPRENRYELDEIAYHYEWGMQRFATIASRNPMAKSALDVLKAVHCRFRNVVSSATARDVPFKVTTSPMNGLTSKSADSLTVANQHSSYPPLSGDLPVPNSYNDRTPLLSDSSSPSTDAHLANSRNGSQWSPSREMPAGQMVDSPFDLTAFAPLQPLHDLLYNDLNTLRNTGSSSHAYDVLESQPLADDRLSSTAWQFDGAFSSSSFWDFMNTYQA